MPVWSNPEQKRERKLDCVLPLREQCFRAPGALLPSLGAPLEHLLLSPGAVLPGPGAVLPIRGAPREQVLQGSGALLPGREHPRSTCYVALDGALLPFF